MKKIALTTLALAVSAGAALAADLPSRKAPVLPPPPPPPMWTGFYAGLNAGGTWANSNNTQVGALPLTDFSGNLREAVGAAASFPLRLSSGSNGGFLGGGQIGYNYQITPMFIIGLEADIQGIAANNGTMSSVGLAPEPGSDDYHMTFVSSRNSVDYLGTVRGRVGILAMPTLLLYGTGGFAYGGVSHNSSFVSYEFEGGAGSLNSFGVGATSFANTQSGWTAGGGLEWMFLPNWSAKVEYLYYDLGSVRANTILVGNDAADNEPDWAYGVNVTRRINGNIVRAGVNYHFNWGAAPVVAKY